MNRAYSVLTVKAVQDDQRIITGVATTPRPDRVGDIVEPLGVQFTNPMPLLHQHDSDRPVGTVSFDKPTKNGITFEARLPKIEDPGPLKDRVDTAWGEIKAGLVRAVSIGFRAIEHAFMDDGGIRFIASEVLELSLVSVPANADAKISTIKSIDAPLLAATGKEPKASDRPVPPGVTGKATKPVKLLTPEDIAMSGKKTVAEQISAFEATRQAKAARQAELMAESGDKGETLDAEQATEYDDLAVQVKQIDDHLTRLRALEQSNIANAKAVNGSSTETASESRGNGTVRVSAQKAAPGIRFARVVKCVGMAKGNLMQAEQIAMARYGDDVGVVGVLKAAVAAGTVGGATWAGPLVGDETGVFADFVEFLRPLTILGKFGTNGIPSLRQVPFRTALISQTSGGAAYWVGEGKPKPLTKFDFARTTIEPLKVANIAVVTDEVLRDSSPSAEMIIRDQLAAALRERLDIDFIDPAKAASAGVSPASITNGITAITSTGRTADDIREDIRALFGAFIADNNAPQNGVWIMPATIALALSLLQNPLGQTEFPGIGMNGGTLFGLPVIVSEHVPSDFDGTPTGAIVVLVNASDIYLADDGGIRVDMSREASLQMDNAPGTQDATTGTGTSLVSLWQTNTVGFLAERTINWARRRDGAVQVLDDVFWGHPE